MERRPRPRFLHGSWSTPGGFSTRTTSSRSNLSIVVQAAGAAPPCAGAVDASTAHQVSSTSSSRSGVMDFVGAGNPTHVHDVARPVRVCSQHAGGMNHVEEPRAPQASPHSCGTHTIGAATSDVARAHFTSPAVNWDERVAPHRVSLPGPTFALSRSSSDGRTEGVEAPSSLASLGITNMLTFADCFDSDAEVRGALGVAPQNEQDLAA